MKFLRVITILSAAVLGALACSVAPEKAKAKTTSREIVPSSMGLVTIAKSTIVYARPTLAARQTARLSPGTPLTFLARGGEDRVIGAVYSSWFKVQGARGIRGWVFAGDLANRNPARAPFSYKKLIGVWQYGGTAGGTFPSRVELKRDARFDFNGWGMKDFQSHGGWVYNNLDNTLMLRFFDKRGYWNDTISEADGRLYRVAAGYGKKRPTVYMRVDNMHTRAESRRFNLLGTTFTLASN